MEKSVIEIICSEGIPVNCRGFWYLKDAIIFLLENEEDHVLMTKDLYPEIAKRHHTSVAGVEKAIRNAICKTWEESSNVNRGIHDNRIINHLSKKPTNAQFVFYMLEAARSKRTRITQ